MGVGGLGTRLRGDKQALPTCTSLQTHINEVPPEVESQNVQIVPAIAEPRQHLSIHWWKEGESEEELEEHT